LRRPLISGYVTAVAHAIYLDHHATTPLDPQVLETMLPYYREHFGNAASKQHAYGWVAAEAVEQAREQIAALLGARPKEIIFTSGATEANNLALFGVAAAYRAQGNHIITVCTEHKAILDPAAYLAKNGFDLTYLPVNHWGHIDLERLAAAIRRETILISVMAANNEIGTLAPLATIGSLAKERGVLFHTDAAEALGKSPLDVTAMNVDLVSASAHKLYGPKGVGILYVRSRDPHVRLQPQILGGWHERGLRSGTLPVPLCVGFAKACEIAQELMPTESKKTEDLRDRLYQGLTAHLEGLVRHGDPAHGLPNNLNVSFAGVKAEALMVKLDGVAVSSGSACTTADPKPSHVLRALGISDGVAHSALRFGLGRFSTAEEIDRAIELIVAAVRELRA